VHSHDMLICNCYYILTENEQNGIFRFSAYCSRTTLISILSDRLITNVCTRISYLLQFHAVNSSVSDCFRKSPPHCSYRESPIKYTFPPIRGEGGDGVAMETFFPERCSEHIIVIPISHVHGSKAIQLQHILLLLLLLLLLYVHCLL